METPAKLLVIIDELEIRQAMKARDIVALLFDFDNYLRTQYKYKEDQTALPIRQRLSEMMDDYGIDFNELYP